MAVSMSPWSVPLAKNHRVVVVSPIPWVDHVKASRRVLGVPWTRRRSNTEGFELNYVTFFYPPKILRHLYGSFYWMSISRAIHSLIRRHVPDLVISYWAHPDGEAGARISRMTGAASCLIIGGSDVLLMPRVPSRRRKVVAVLESTNVVVTVSEDLKKAVERLGINPDKVKVWHQGIDVERFRPDERLRARDRLRISEPGNIILWVGRMVPVKGLDVLVRVLLLVADSRGRLPPFPRRRRTIAEQTSRRNAGRSAYLPRSLSSMLFSTSSCPTGIAPPT